MSETRRIFHHAPYKNQSWLNLKESQFTMEEFLTVSGLNHTYKVSIILNIKVVIYMYIYIHGKIFLKKHTILIQFIYIVSSARAIVCETQFSVGNPSQASASQLWMLTLSFMTACRGYFITVVSSSVSDRSTVSPGLHSHANS